MRKTLMLFLLAVVLTACSGPSPGPVQINEIQGRGHISPYLREAVEGVMGIVTAIPLGTGFYMQTPEPDGDPATSDGIYVDTTAPVEASVGDLVHVSGKVDEAYLAGGNTGNLPVTILRRVEVKIVERGVGAPAPVVIGTGGRIPPGEIVSDDSTGTVDSGEFDPENDGLDFYESLESMLVQVNDAQSVGTAHTAYGEIWIVPDSGAHASALTPRGGIVLREGDPNPDRILIDYIEDEPFYRHIGPMRTSVGDLYTEPIVGVISYSYLNFKIVPLDALPAVTPNPLPREEAAPAGSDTLSVATFNVYNLSPRDPEEKFDDLGATIVDGLAAPDIVVLEEVQDNDGPRRSDLVSADETAALLIAAIGRAGGPDDYVYVDIHPEYNADGGEPNANIRVGFLYRATRVGFEARPGGDATTPAVVEQRGGAASLLANPSRVSPTAQPFVNSRKPLVGEFTFRGRTIFVIGNHLNSKSGDSGPFGWIQPPTFRSGETRARQAEEIGLFVDGLLAVEPQALVIVTGDLNDFAFSEPVRVLEGEGRLLNLATELLPENEIYTYIYEGNSQALDHILVSEALFTSYAPEIDIVHRYCEYLYEERYSDHDPVLARFRF